MWPENLQHRTTHNTGDTDKTQELIIHGTLRMVYWSHTKLLTKRTHTDANSIECPTNPKVWRRHRFIGNVQCRSLVRGPDRDMDDGWGEPLGHRDMENPVLEDGLDLFPVAVRGQLNGGVVGAEYLPSQVLYHQCFPFHLHVKILRRHSWHVDPHLDLLLILCCVPGGVHCSSHFAPTKCNVMSGYICWVI